MFYEESCINHQILHMIFKRQPVLERANGTNVQADPRK